MPARHPFLMVLFASLICAATALPAGAQSAGAPETYRSAELGVHVDLPAGWTANEASTRGNELEFWAPDGKALCGVNTGAVRFVSATEWADFMTEFTAEHFAQRGLEQVVVERRDVTTASGVPGVAVLVDIVVGGRSQRYYFLRDSAALVIDCECATTEWNAHAEDFQKLFVSFDYD